jgi:hypothetical protein
MSLPRLLGVLSLSLAFAGCRSIQPIDDPARFITQSQPAVVFVTHSNGAELTIARPHMSGDSLLGTWQGASQSLALPLNSVKQVRAERPAKTRTIVMISGLTIVAGSLAFLVAQDAGSGGFNCDYSIREQPSPQCYNRP